MNLVAKEFVAAQDPLDPGVLVLSRFAGAARELTAALLVNPIDIIFRAAIPSICLQALGLFLCIMFPQIILYLPRTLYAGG